MKILLLMSLLFISTCFFAQDKEMSQPEVVTDRTDQWMTNISTNPELRLKMMQMMIKQTTAQPHEMRLLVNQIMDNSEMKKMINEALSQKTNNGNNPMDMSDIMNKYNTVMEKTPQHKKPKIEK